MKRTIIILITFFALKYAGKLNGQSDSDSVRVIYKNKTVTVKPQGNESVTTIRFNDSATGKKIVVNVSIGDKAYTDSTEKKVINFIKQHIDEKERKHLIETYFLPTIDIGFAGTANETENRNAINPVTGKSAHISIGLIKQDINISKKRLFFSYGLNYHQYYLKYADKQQMQYLDNNGILSTYTDSLNNYDKNRLNVRYLVVPVFLEYHSKNDKFSIAGGVELGFLGKSKLTLKGDRNSLDFKQKNENDISINPTQLNAVIRIGLNGVAVYGKYAITDMYSSSAYRQGENPHQHLYSFGICIFGI